MEPYFVDKLENERFYKNRRTLSKCGFMFG